MAIDIYSVIFYICVLFIISKIFNKMILFHYKNNSIGRAGHDLFILQMTEWETDKLGDNLDNQPSMW
jgi:hypothetical protein